MNRRAILMPIGGSSLLVIFSVLTLSVFALLGLSTVRAGLRLAEGNRKATEQFYEADRRAEDTLAELRQGKLPEGVEAQGNVFAYSVPISKTQVLSVVVTVEKENYEIHQWKAINSKEWNPDEYIKVWTPD
ncbi:MAG: hypothetical protein E7222_12965 [Clostridiales bacterium]|nr:hypothetical protein [Clostridiales bacterium]